MLQLDSDDVALVIFSLAKEANNGGLGIADLMTTMTDEASTVGASIKRERWSWKLRVDDSRRSYGLQVTRRSGWEQARQGEPKATTV